MIRKATREDAQSICEIYNHYVLNTHSTFEEKAIDESIISNRMQLNEELSWWVYEENHRVQGYAYACPWKMRSAYQYTLEVSIYFNKDKIGKGNGSLLYTQLIDELRSKNYSTLLAGIALPNPRSIKFHEVLGFRKVGQLEKVGFKLNRWIDVGYWQLNL
ncbi:MAG: GNAT family N-acetyltransferase [Flavobacteriaceae bacterium]